MGEDLDLQIQVKSFEPVELSSFEGFPEEYQKYSPALCTMIFSCEVNTAKSWESCVQIIPAFGASQATEKQAPM